MKVCRWIFSALLLFGGAIAAQAYEAGYPFDQYKQYDFAQHECPAVAPNMFEKGPYKASCRLWQLSHLVGMGDETKRKFVALACGRGNTADMAKFNARTHAQDLINNMQDTDLKRRGREPETNQRYDNDDYKDHCVMTGGPSAKTATREDDQYIPPPDYEPDAPDNEPPPRLVDPEPRPDPNRNVAIFKLHNADRYKLGVQFVSETRNHAWPGNNRQYVLSGTSTYRLSCQPGEKICFGAWRDYQTTYWGVGHGHEGCIKCCIRCGGSLETRLTDGGADSFRNNNSGQTVNNALNIMTGVLGIVNSMNSMRSQPTYRAPIRQYRQPPNYHYGPPVRGRESDITGH